MAQKLFSYTTVLYPDENGGFRESVPALPGCFPQGRTETEAIEMAKEAICVTLKGRRKQGSPPQIRTRKMVEQNSKKLKPASISNRKP